MNEFMFNSSALDRFAGRRVLVIGDVMLDEYIYGDADRISPEAPVPVVRLQNRTYAGGGAANAATNITSLGGLPVLVGVAGQDEQRDRLRRTLEEAGIRDDGIISDPARPTTVKTRVMAQGQQLVRVDSEAAMAIAAEIEEQILGAALDVLQGVDSVLLCDYAKGVLTDRVCQTVIKHARAAGKATLVDPKGHDFAKYVGVTVVTPNRKEAALAVGHLHLPDDVHAWGTALLAMLGGSAVLITRGSQGMTLFREGLVPLDVPAQAKSVYDVTGAGDTVVATAAMALAAGAPLEEAVPLANVAASIVVRKIGTASATLDELVAALREGGATSANEDSSAHSRTNDRLARLLVP